MPRPRPNASTLHLRHTAFGDALAFAQAARFDEALANAQGVDSPEARLLAARLKLRMGLPADAIRELRAAKGFAPAHRVSAEILIDAARARLSPTYYEIAVPESASRSARAMAFYFRGCTEWRHNRIEAAGQSAGLASSVGDRSIRPLALQLEGWVAVRLNRFPQAIDLFARSIAEMEDENAYDEFAKTAAVHGMASAAVETLKLDVLPRVVALVDELQPTPWTNDRWLQALAYAAEAYSLLGDDNRAYATLLRAREATAPNTLGRASIDTDLGSFSFRRGQSEIAKIHFDMARDAFFAVDWSRSNVEQRAVLATYAAEAAGLDNPSAARALTLARSISGTRDLSLAFEHDARASILVRVAEARIVLHRDPEAAAASLETSLASWKKIGYRYRAAITALDLVPFGSRAASATLRSLAKSMPAWFRAQAKAEAKRQQSPLKELTEAEQSVVDGICRGLTSRQIAEDAGKSVSTVRNQTISVYRRLGVSTRTALVALVKDAAAAR